MDIGKLDLKLLIAFEAMLDARMALWDSAPLGVIVSEAGGKYFDFSGAVRIDGGNLASCATGVADAVLEMLTNA